MKVEISYKPTDKQAVAHIDKHLYLLYGGAMGGAKTIFLVMETFFNMFEFTGNRGFLGRKIGKSFKQTVWPEWETRIPKELYHVNWATDIVKIKTHDGGTSELLIGGLDRGESKIEKDTGIKRLTSSNLGFFGIDQAEEITEL